MAVRGEDAEDEGDPGEKGRRRELEDRKRNRRSLAVRIISRFRALSFVKSTWQYHCLSIKLKSLTPEYYSVKYPALVAPVFPLRAVSSVSARPSIVVVVVVVVLALAMPARAHAHTLH